MISGPFHWRSAARTDQGNVRDHNEDACLDRGDAGFWVVADGMGGHEAGDFASRLIVERLGHLGEFDRPSQFVDRVEDELLGVNHHLYQKSQAAPQPTIIGSTVVTLLALDSHAVTVWAGDSRVYRMRGGELTRVSRDHSEVEELVAQGLVKAEDAESHPQANVITRAVGGAEHLYLDYEPRDLMDGDRYLLCSDGLYKDVTEAELATELQKGDCDLVCNTLIELALSRECADNVTVLIVDFEALETTVAPASPEAGKQEDSLPAQADKQRVAAPKVDERATVLEAADIGDAKPQTDSETDSEMEEEDPEITQPRPVTPPAAAKTKSRAAEEDTAVPSDATQHDRPSRSQTEKAASPGEDTGPDKLAKKDGEPSPGQAHRDQASRQQASHSVGETAADAGADDGAKKG